MDDRQQIEARLRKKEQEIQALEERIKAARIYMQALRDVLRMLEGEADGRKPRPQVDRGVRAGSAVAQARDVILQQGRPMHVHEIVDALGKPQTRENRTSIGSSLAAYVRRNEIFTRPAPNTFGLIELGHDAVSESAEEPPPEFGRMEEPPDANDPIPF